MPRQKQKSAKAPEAKWTWQWSDESEPTEAFDSYEDALDDAESMLERSNFGEDDLHIVIYMMVPKAKLTKASVRVEKL